MNVRRVGAREVIQVAGFSVLALLYVYVIGWLITWVRLAAARLPISLTLPATDDKLLFSAGLRIVLLMAVVFGAMCAVAWAVHAWTWRTRAPEWHCIVEHNRTYARRELRPAPLTAPLRKPGVNPPADLRRAPVGDAFVRVIAGFNVGVLAASIGLGLAQIAEGLINQVHPGYWWALLLPWLVLSIALVLLLTWIGPLRGNRLVHGVIWGVAVILALLATAPIGLLLLTWVGIATLGRAYGTGRRLPGSKLEFALSPLPWVLLTIYALVGLTFSATPPVTFSQTVLTTPQGTRVGGYLARTGDGLYLASCTPLADATSINVAVSFIPAAQVQRLSSDATNYSFDSGARPSLPTLALHGLGIDAAAPTLLKPELRARKAPCAGSPLPQPSVGSEMPELGAGVIAGPAPPGGRAHDGEAPVDQTSRRIAGLAHRFAPTLLVTVADRFWPVSVGAVLADVGEHGTRTCLHVAVTPCGKPAPQPRDLAGAGSKPNYFLQYPATPALDMNPTGQLDAFLRGQQQDQTPIPSQHQWLADPGLLDPWYTGQIYFYYAGAADRLRWPVATPGNLTGLDALQYWFFYPYNYYPTVATPDLMNDAPIAADVVNVDLHQGDWEHVTVLVARSTGKPVWLYMARHSNEGQFYPWGSPALRFDDGHPIVQAAIGGHPSYDPRCGERRRYANNLAGVVSDWIVCGSGRFAFRAATTPLVDLAHTNWACWQGHFGVATASEVSDSRLSESSLQREVDSNLLVAGPRSPLWQAENGHLSADGSPAKNTGFCANGRDPAAPESGPLPS